MSILDKLLEDPSSNKKDNVIKHDKLDKENFKDIKTNSGRLDDSVEEAQNEMSTADKLAEDIFYSLYKYDPKQNKKDELKSQYKMNKDFLQKATDTQEYDSLRSRTQMDEMQSAIGTVSFLSKVLEKVDDEDIEEVNKKAQELDKQQGEIESLIDQIQGLESLDETNDEVEEELEKKKEELEKLKNQQKEIEEEIEQDLKNASSAMRNAARQGMESAKEKTQEIDDLVAGWGLGGKSSLQELPLDKRIELAKDLKDNKKLQEIADMIGSMKRLALSVRKNKTNKKPDEIQNITRGGDLSRALPSELALLATEDETAELLFMKKKAKKQLPQYELKGKEEKGKGPIIACVDTSGSMSGQKEIWAKGVATGLYHVARRENRDFIGILFSYSEDSMRTYKLLGNDIDTEEQLTKFKEFAQGFLGGNTDFNPPLERSIQIIASGVETDSTIFPEKLEGYNYEQADIVFITDGQAKITDSLKYKIEKLKDKLEFKIIGIGIGPESGGLDDFSDVTYSIRDIVKEGEETAEETFHSIQ